MHASRVILLPCQLSLAVMMVMTRPAVMKVVMEQVQVLKRMIVEVMVEMEVKIHPQSQYMKN